MIRKRVHVNDPRDSLEAEALEAASEPVAELAESLQVYDLAGDGLAFEYLTLNG